MLATLRVAVIQLRATLDVAANLAQAERLVREAAAGGAQLVVLPELFQAYGRLPEVIKLAEAIPGPTSTLLCALARECQITLVGGSFGERTAHDPRGYNTSLLIDPAGEIMARYRKLHLFDVDLPGQVTVKESDSMLPGEEVVATSTRLGVIGQAICYDLRFPELFRALSQRGAELICVPSAFTATTGRDHWEVLLRARAIENQCYFLASNQYGEHAPGSTSYGGSLIIDPWGEVLARGPLDRDAVLFAELHEERIKQVRARLPALQHRRM
ncbi:MAG TPA: carbon-nitrogen hydrolase family protein [Pirellulaceae bacterium]|nr:carbon-nitrogen hydrolase family protein [Pirellulaceae bacterium]